MSDSNVTRGAEGTKYPSNFEDFKKKSPFVAETLTKKDHDASELHFIGDALPTATKVTAIPTDPTAPFVGVSPIPAREDHNHGLNNDILIRSEGDIRYVQEAGDTMTGTLTINNAPGGGFIGVQLFTAGAITARRDPADGPLVVLYRGKTFGGSVGESYIRFMNASGSPDNQSGNITLQAGNTVNYGTSSDYRLKEEQGLITSAIERLKKLRPIRFIWKQDPQIEQDGFFAHEAAEVVPEAVVGEKDEIDEEGIIVPQQLDPGKIVPLLVAALQDAITRIEALEHGV